MPESASETLVLLHGFAGTGHTWDEVVEALDRERYRPLALDLPGHGSQSGRAPVSFAACTAGVLDAAPARFALCGYSMGARIALQVALADPERVQRLALIGVNPGIEDPVMRERRRVSDRDLADRIEKQDDIDAFASAWRAQPLFRADPGGVSARALQDYRRNRPTALAASLRVLGTGVMEPLWERLPELAMPVVVIVGSRDVSYRSIAERVIDVLPDGRLEIVPGGHAAHLESPGQIAAVLQSRG